MPKGTRNDTGEKCRPPEGVGFQKGQSGNPAGRPKGSISLKERMRRLMEEIEVLPPNVREYIREKYGADKQAVDAILLSMMLKGILDGDTQASKLVLEIYEPKKQQIELSGSIAVTPEEAEIFERAAARIKDDYTG